MYLYVTESVFALLPILLSSCVSEERKGSGRLQCLKWAVSQSPWSFPSCRNLIINNHGHIRDKGCKCIYVYVHTQKNVYNMESDKKKAKRKRERVCAHKRPSFCVISNTIMSVRSHLTHNECCSVSKLLLANS